LAAPLGHRHLPGGASAPLHPCLLHQPPHCASIRGKLGGYIGEQPLLLDQPVFQVGSDLGEARSVKRTV
jgi:hypothetical protein